MPLDEPAAAARAQEPPPPRTQWRITMPHPLENGVEYVADATDGNPVAALASVVNAFLMRHPKLTTKVFTGEIVMRPVHRGEADADVTGVPS